MTGNAHTARRTVVATGPTNGALNRGKLAARLSSADRAALWILRQQAPLTCVWSQGFAHSGLERERSFIEHLRYTEDMLSGRPRTLSRESINSCLRVPKDQARAGGWRFATLWPIHNKNRLFGIVVCYFDDSIPPNPNRVKHIQAVLTRDSFAFGDPPSQTSSLLLISQRRLPGDLTLSSRAKEPAAQICELTLDPIRLALPFWAGAMVAVGRSERSSFHIVPASGAFKDQVGARYPSLGTLSRAWEAKRLDCDPVQRGPLIAALALDKAIGAPTGIRLLLAPLRIGERLLGALIAVSRKDEDHSMGSTPVLQGIADLAASALHHLSLETQLEEVRAGAVLALAGAAQARDGYTGDHSKRLAPWAEETARRLGCPSDEVDDVRWGALLHDIGKIAVPDPILLKPGPLSEEEWSVIRLHPEVGERIVSAVHRLRRTAEFIRHHQERFDGKGYPDALQGEGIPLGSRILAVVDSYGAIRDERPYKSSRSHQEAVVEIERCKGTQFDPKVVEAFLDVIETRPGRAKPAGPLGPFE
ncbi:MAG: HD domain-containing phosphohydrolase [Anaerolineales bacterium]